jgi:predicted peptidase
MLYRVICCAAVALFRATPVLADTGFLDRTIVFEGKSFRYLVYVPAEYTAAKAWPVVVDLHGNGNHGTDGLSHTEVGMAVAIRRNRPAFPAIVVLPQAPPDEYWEQLPMQELVLAELESTEKEFNIDRSREYLTGHSMGGAAAFRIAYRWPTRFAAIVAIDGTVEPIPAGHGAVDRAEIDRRTNPFTVEGDPYGALATRIRGVPLWIIHGDADQVVSVTQPRQLVTRLRALNAQVRYTEYLGAQHMDAIAKAYAEPDLMKWLLSHQRPPA